MSRTKGGIELAIAVLDDLLDGLVESFNGVDLDDDWRGKMIERVDVAKTELSNDRLRLQAILKHEEERGQHASMYTVFSLDHILNVGPAESPKQGTDRG